MKKNVRTIGLIYAALGIAGLAVSILLDNRLGSILFGMSFGLTAGGLGLLWRYYYWNRPANVQRYKERLDNESIELHDERKEQLRNKAGRYAYILGFLVCTVTIIVCGILQALRGSREFRNLIVYLWVYMIVQYAAGIVIYRLLCRKY